MPFCNGSWPVQEGLDFRTTIFVFLLHRYKMSVSTLQDLVHQRTDLPGKGADSQQDVLNACLPHLSADFKATADVLIEIDSGIRCSVHSQLLSNFSEALCHYLAVASSNEKVLRLKGCDARDLFNILESIYSRGRRVRSVDAAVSLTKLADNCSDSILKAECDALLTACADRPCSILAPKVHFSSFLTGCMWEAWQVYLVLSP